MNPATGGCGYAVKHCLLIICDRKSVNKACVIMMLLSDIDWYETTSQCRRASQQDQLEGKAIDIVRLALWNNLNKGRKHTAMGQ